MLIYVLNTAFDTVKVIDSFESAIWTDRYNEYGDFELYLVMDPELLDYLQMGYYLWQKDSEHLMIIEKIEISSDAEVGNRLIVTGRSLESILSRRIIWGQYTFYGTLQDAVRQILTDSIISPSISDRRISNFIFKASTDPNITKLRIDTQYTGDNVYDVIEKLCQANDIGFKVTLNESNQFVFELYAGTDRTYAQEVNPFVIFSPRFDNMLNSNFIANNMPVKTVTFIAGEGEGSARKTAVVGAGEGLERRELFTDARDISSQTNSGTLTDAEYLAKLQQRGTEKLAECIPIVGFEGAAETTRMFKYGEDFFVGDIVQVANEYGHETEAIVSELVFSQNESGYTVYPTFKTYTRD